MVVFLLQTVSDFRTTSACVLSLKTPIKPFGMAHFFGMALFLVWYCFGMALFWYGTFIGMAFF